MVNMQSICTECYFIIRVHLFYDHISLSYREHPQCQITVRIDSHSVVHRSHMSGKPYCNRRGRADLTSGEETLWSDTAGAEYCGISSTSPSHCSHSASRWYSWTRANEVKKPTNQERQTINFIRPVSQLCVQRCSVLRRVPLGLCFCTWAWLTSDSLQYCQINN